MSESALQRNKKFVLEAFDTLFNKKDFVAAEKFWSPNYIQHSAHIPPGRDGLFSLIKSTPPEMRYENSLIMAEGDMLMLHGRFSGLGLPANWIVVDIVRIENGLLAEHWDVIEDEVTREKSASGLPMFGVGVSLLMICVRNFHHLPRGREFSWQKNERTTGRNEHEIARERAQEKFDALRGRFPGSTGRIYRRSECSSGCLSPAS
jgi:predicted SnoaL-like aldol condensation-catalyzing enzyme